MRTSEPAQGLPEAAVTLTVEGLKGCVEGRAKARALDRSPRLLLTVEEAAERIGICRSNMFKLIRQGDVRSVKVGRLRRITPAALEDFIAQLSGEESA
jgi:excisionase family DNA binding protein